LNIVRHDFEVFTKYDQIPPFFELDLTGYEIGKSIHVSAVAMPEGVTPVIKGRDFTIATIAGALKGDSEDAAAAEAAPAAAAGKGAPAAAAGKGAPAAAAGKGAPAAAAGKGAPAAAAGKGAAPAKPAGKK
jgi:large subunit ribosomal protein L25